jgi:hypothetical protein
MPAPVSRSQIIDAKECKPSAIRGSNDSSSIDKYRNASCLESGDHLVASRIVVVVAKSGDYAISRIQLR